MKVTMKPLILFALFSCLAVVYCDTLEEMNTDEVLELIQEEQFVVVMFTRDQCDKCVKYEETLTQIREDIVEDLNAWVVRTNSDSLLQQLGIVDAPAIVFFRNKIPLLYDGPMNDEVMLEYIVSNQESSVHQLNDDTFEHQTQAATGATTGDWLAVFSREDCETCATLQATIEAVAANLKGSKNVAVINKDTDGGATARRFEIREFPAFILFRLGNMYRFNLPKADVASLTSFAQDWYKNARMEKVPTPKSPFDDLTEQIADFVRENPLYLYGFFGVLLVVLIGSFMQVSATNKAEQKKKKKK